MNKDSVKKIAFYLPQFHAIPENDKWWGNGFTDWTNVKKAAPLYNGHYQPQVPTDEVGYYDLSDIKVIEKQAKLASQFGIDGFCFYHYWFAGKKLLDTPLKNILKTGKPNFPFCVCWANENTDPKVGWSREGSSCFQKHSDEDDLAFINDLLELFKDDRYIKIGGKPLLIIYRTSLFPDIKKSAEIWRRAVKEAGFKGLYLARVEGIEQELDPKTIGFDAAIEFAPDWRLNGVPINQQKETYEAYVDNGIFSQKYPLVYDYNAVMNNMINKKHSNYKYFRGVFPSWDNTPRRGQKSTVYWGSSPEVFEYFLSRQIQNTSDNTLLSEEEKIVFINAWNEWGEGCHLEPDEKNGFGYLESVKLASTLTPMSINPLYATLSVLGKRTTEMSDELIKLHQNYDMSELENHQREQRIQVLEEEIKNIKNSKIWKARNKVAKLFGKPIV